MASSEFGEIIIRFSPEATKTMNDLEDALRQMLRATEEIRKTLSEEDQEDVDS